MFSRLWPRATARSATRESIVYGMLFGLTTCVGMALPVEIAPGIFTDCRAVLIALAFLFGGTVTGLSAMVPAILFRLWIGGAGTFPGIGIIVTAGLVGVLFNAVIRDDHDKPRYSHLILLGILLAVFSNLWVLALPKPLQWDVLSRLIPGLTLLSPVATVLLGTLLKMDRDHRTTATALTRESRFFRQATQSASVGVWEMDYRTGLSITRKTSRKYSAIRKARFPIPT